MAAMCKLDGQPVDGQPVVHPMVETHVTSALRKKVDVVDGVIGATANLAGAMGILQNGYAAVVTGVFFFLSLGLSAARFAATEKDIENLTNALSAMDRGTAHTAKEGLDMRLDSAR